MRPALQGLTFGMEANTAIWLSIHFDVPLNPLRNFTMRSLFMDGIDTSTPPDDELEVKFGRQ